MRKLFNYLKEYLFVSINFEQDASALLLWALPIGLFMSTLFSVLYVVVGDYIRLVSTVIPSFFLAFAYFQHTYRGWRAKSVMKLMMASFFASVFVGMYFHSLDDLGFQSVYFLLVLVGVFLGERDLLLFGGAVMIVIIMLYILELTGRGYVSSGPTILFSEMLTMLAFIVLIVIFLRVSVQQIIRSRDQMIIARDDANAANTAKSQFLANVSHELRTPLNAIIGYSDLMLEEMQDDDFDASLSLIDVERIRNSGDYLLALVNNILDISKMESGEMRLEWGRGHLPSLLNEMCGMIEPLIVQNNNRFEYACMGIDQTVYLDVGKFRQILLNLVSNANKFTESGEIKVAIFVPEGEEDEAFKFVLQVMDTGIGIAPENQKQIFEMFHQVDNSLTRKFKGSGLGLALVKTFSEMMGGEVRLHSVAGDGSTFSVTLPLIPADGELTEAQQLLLAG